MRSSAIGVIIASLGAFAPAYAQTVTVTPTAVSVHLGTFFQFSARVTGTTPTTVGWTIALPAGATGSPGTIRNRPPVAGADDVVTDEDTAITFGVLGNDTDPDGDARARVRR